MKRSMRKRYAIRSTKSSSTTVHRPNAVSLATGTMQTQSSACLFCFGVKFQSSVNQRWTRDTLVLPRNYLISQPRRGPHRVGQKQSENKPTDLAIATVGAFKIFKTR
jgi:hypothetical protein